MLLVPKTEGDINDTEGAVVQQRLMCDAHVTAFFDADYFTEFYYIPSENALLIYGQLFKHN